MDKHHINIMYKLADGKQIRVEVTIPVKDLLEQADRQIRSQRRQDRRYLEKAEYIDGLTDTTMIYPQDDPADLLIRMDNYQQLYTAVARLSELQRRRLRLYYCDELTYRQIAEMEGVSHSTVAESIKRAIEKLRQFLNS